ncbi:hypothetical protein K2A42_004443 [Salmonella enterica subsp. enterica serovar Agama]|nr:hypothetical protein [Salmonella enterica subsp. enterica serovar Agama]
MLWSLSPTPASAFVPVLTPVWTPALALALAVFLLHRSPDQKYKALTPVLTGKKAKQGTAVQLLRWVLSLSLALSLALALTLTLTLTSPQPVNRSRPVAV